MEEANMDQFLKEYMQILAKSDISKEDLTDSIAYFKDKYFLYFCKHYKRYNVGILNFFTDMLLKFDLIYADPPKQFTKSAKEVAGKLFESFIKMLGKCTIVEEIEYFLPDEA